MEDNGGATFCVGWFEEGPSQLNMVRWVWCLCFLCLGCRAGESEKATDSSSGRLANGHGLVTVEWLKSLIDSQSETKGRASGRTSEASPSTSGFVIVEASWADLPNAKDYHRGHLPGAIHVNTDVFENGYPEWKLRSVESLQRTIGELGIAPDTTVIVYSEQLIAATRVWWVLMYAGVVDVRILDGDARTWSEAGFELEQTTRELVPVSFVAAPRIDWLIDSGSIRVHLESNSQDPGGGQVVPLRLFDMRSRGEYEGQISGYTYLDAKGRIPTAVSLGDADDASQTYKLVNGRLRPPSEIYAEWRTNGLDIVNEIQASDSPLLVFYCGGGWRSSAAFFYAWLSGADNIRNYSEGWAGWSTRYVRDESAKGNTPGWLQLKTDNPVENAPAGLGP